MVKTTAFEPQLVAAAESARYNARAAAALFGKVPVVGAGSG